MKPKSLSESSLEELLNRKRKLNSVIISLEILGIIILAIMAILSKYNLLPTLIPFTIAVIFFIYNCMNELNSEIKKRYSRDS